MKKPMKIHGDKGLIEPLSGFRGLFLSDKLPDQSSVTVLGSLLGKQYDTEPPQRIVQYSCLVTVRLFVRSGLLTFTYQGQVMRDPSKVRALLQNCGYIDKKAFTRAFFRNIKANELILGRSVWYVSFTKDAIFK